MGMHMCTYISYVAWLKMVYLPVRVCLGMRINKLTSTYCVDTAVIFDIKAYLFLGLKFQYVRSGNAKIAAHVADRRYTVKFCNSTLENKHWTCIATRCFIP